MKQQINLYQAEFRPQRKAFSASSGFMLIIFFVVVFAGIYVYEMREVKKLEGELAGINSDVEKLTMELDRLAAQFPGQEKSRILESEIKRIDEEIQKRQQIKDALASHSVENKRIFSALLESLARKHVAGTWLTQVSISRGGTALGFAGKSYSSELVPKYIQNLSEESSFKGLSFNVLELNRSPDDPASLDFIVRTHPEQL